MTLGNSLTYAFTAGRPIKSGKNEEGERAVLYSRGVLMVDVAGSITIYKTALVSRAKIEAFFADNYPLPD